jgi:MATE family multidrug resistance protein
VSALLSQKRGEGEKIDHYLRPTLIYTLIISIPIVFISLATIFILPLFNFEPHLIPIIKEYIFITSFSIPFVFIFQAFKEYLQSQEKTFLANLSSVIGVFVNLFFNTALVFGLYGIPRMDEVGLAWASFLVRVFLAIFLGLIVLKELRIKQNWINKKYFKDLFDMGLPLSIALFFEVMAFCSISLLVGKFGVEQGAANQIVLTVASVIFMVPLSISVAMTVKVGYSYGEKNPEDLKMWAKSGMILSCCFTTFSGVILLLFPQFIFSVLSTDMKLFVFFGLYLKVVALFQFFDGSQATLSAILRGMGQTSITSKIVLFGYWIIGLPLGALLAYQGGLQGYGYWIGLGISLALVASLLGYFTIKEIHRWQFHINGE